MKDDFDDIPLSQSSVSLRLAEIQRRCSDFVDDPENSDGLALEDHSVESDNNNPYNRAVQSAHQY